MSDLNIAWREPVSGVRKGLLMLAAIFCLMFFSALVNAAGQAAELPSQGEFKISDSRAYRLGAGDVINITVYGEDDLSRQKYRLPDSGLIMFPFGEVRALGLSIADLEIRIADGLRGGYLLNPRVSVSMDEYRPFFINGQVNQPGAYPYKSGLTVRMAVSIAGGFKERASESKIFVVRETDPLHTQSKIGLDGDVLPGDTVTVEESFF